VLAPRTTGNKVLYKVLYIQSGHAVTSVEFYLKLFINLSKVSFGYSLFYLEDFILKYLLCDCYTHFTMTDLRLNLGCGAKRLDGYVNVDKFGEPDLRFDLETFPYPWDNNSVAEIEMHHVLEHLGQQTEVYLKIIQELYRICKPGAKLHITVPHHRSDSFFHDPTHVRAITPVGLSMLSKRQNREWLANSKAFTLLALYLDVDFELVHVAYTPGELWFERYPESASDTQFLLKESAIYSNLIKQVEMIVIAVK